MAHVRRREDGRIVLCAESDQDVSALARVLWACIERRWESAALDSTLTDRGQGHPDAPGLLVSPTTQRRM